MNNPIEKYELLNVFVEEFIKLWFTEFDFVKVTSFLSEGATFVGMDVSNCKTLFEKTRPVGSLHFKDKFNVRSIGGGVNLVYGKLLWKLDDNGDSCEENEFFVVCKEFKDSFLICHGHFSGFGDNEVYDVTTKDDDFMKKSEDRRLLMESFADNICGGVQICSYDKDFTIKYISEGFTDMFGYSMEELWNSCEGKHINLVHENDKKLLGRSIADQLKNTDSFCVEYRMIHKNGSTVWVLDKGKLISGIDGSMNVQCILTDITDKKLYENELMLSKKRYEIAMKFSDMGMFEYNFATKILTLFDGINDMYNMPSVVENGIETFVQSGIIEPESVSAYRSMYKAVEQGAPWDSCYIKSKDMYGKIHDYELNLTGVVNNDGEVELGIGVRKNITDMVKLRKEEEFAIKLIENKELVMEIDITKNRFVYIAKGWEGVVKVDANASYAYCISEFVDCYVAPEHRQYVYKNLSLINIKNQINAGRFAFEFAYKSKVGEGSCLWYDATVSIVNDGRTGDMIARIYRENINERKEKELKALEVQRRYSHMVDKSIHAFEINYTRDVIYKGHESWYEQNGKVLNKNYSEVIREFAKTNLSEEEGELFLEAVSREHMLELFERGERNFVYECNEMFEDGSSRWLECSLYFYEEADSGDVRCFAYMNDISRRKTEELQLKFDAEHDSMTGMYNKIKTEEKINQLLGENVNNFKALLVIDIDCFKAINDNFGHFFGDDVIRNIAKIIISAFRKTDIVGRIGGDEFCIFLDGVDGLDNVKKKAEELRLMLCNVYSKDGVDVNISASIGIAVAGIHGNNYYELYINADSALYIAKNNGKNRFQISN